MKTFADILNSNPDDIKAPQALPVGTYLWTVVGLPKTDLKSGKTGTEGVRFIVKCIAPQEDVDKEALSGLPNWQGKEQRLDFWVTEESAYRLRDFLVNDLQIDKASMSQMLSQTPNRSFLGRITHSVSQDGKGVFGNISETKPAG